MRMAASWLGFKRNSPSTLMRAGLQLVDVHGLEPPLAPNPLLHRRALSRALCVPYRQ
jgi:hypothetical protein